MDFGKEAIPLQVTEFCEVFNASPTDPCAWAACISKTLKNGEYMVRRHTLHLEWFQGPLAWAVL